MGQAHVQSGGRHGLPAVLLQGPLLRRGCGHAGLRWTVWLAMWASGPQLPWGELLRAGPGVAALRPSLEALIVGLELFSFHPSTPGLGARQV